MLVIKEMNRRRCLKRPRDIYVAGGEAVTFTTNTWWRLLSNTLPPVKYMPIRINRTDSKCGEQMQANDLIGVQSKENQNDDL